jgi:hypothetical protein
MNLLNRFLFLSCKQATEYVEQKKVVGISTINNLRLRRHLQQCKACDIYSHYSDIIDEVFQHILKDTQRMESVSDNELSSLIQKITDNVVKK